MKVDKSKWVETAFAEIATSQLGKTLDANKNTGLPYPYLCAANVGMGYFNLSNVKEILLEESELEKYLVRKGDLLICEGGDTGRCSIWESEQPIYYQNALHRVRFNEDTYNKFIMYYLHYYKKVGVIDRLSHGQTIKHFTQKGLNKLSFKLPSLAIQRTIAKELDSIQEMIEGYKEQITDLDELAKSIFLETFGDPTSNEKGWETILLSNFVEQMFIGPFGSALKKDCFVDKENSHCIVYEQKHAIQKTMDFEPHYINKTKYDELSRFDVKPGDIIVSCRGTIGEMYVIPSDAPLGIIHPSLMKIRVKSNVVLTYFLTTLKYIFNKQKTKGTCVQMAIKASELSKLPVPNPSITLQKKFDEQIKSIENQKELLREHLADAEQLMAERMQYYFS